MKSLCLAMIGGVISLTVVISCKSPEAPVYKNQVERLAESINFKCPFLVDEDTRMDSVHILPDSTFQYNYTLINQDKDKLDITGLRNYIGPRLQHDAMNSSTMKLHRDHNLSLVFYYRDRNGEFVLQIVLEPEDYIY